MTHISHRADDFAQKLLKKSPRQSREAQLAQDAVGKLPVKRRLRRRYMERRNVNAGAR